MTKLRGLAAQQEGPGNIAARAETERQITAMIGRLFAVAEAYPDLKANQNFQQLQADLGEVEDQIQLARRYYNGTVRDYNIMVPRFVVNNGNGLDLGEWQAETGQDDHSLSVEPEDVLVDPLGTDIADYMLKAGSPALNAALAALAPATDINGQGRPQGSGTDCGCFEQP